MTARERYESVKWEMQHQLPPFSGWEGEGCWRAERTPGSEVAP